MTVEFGRVFPVFRIFSLEKAREFYLDFLGFSVDWEHRFEPGAPVYMQVSRGTFALRLSEHHGDGTPGSIAYVNMSGVRDLQRELNDKSYPYNRPGLQQQEWGMLELTVIDPFNNRITFGEASPRSACRRARLMPELPEVETVRRGLAPVMEGATIVKAEIRRADLRSPFPPRFGRRLAGRRILGMGRRAKYLTADLDDGSVLLMHLGMSGSFRIEAEGASDMIGSPYHPRTKLRAHDHVVFHLSSGVRVVFNDPRRFGMMDLIPRTEIAASKHFRAMGIEPLGNEFDPAALAGLLAGRKAPLKAALMDQRLVAGLGNIYVCEALWRARLSPDRVAGTLATKTGKPTAAAVRLAEAIREVLTAAIAAGGSSLRDHIRATGELGDFQHTFAVYDREGEPCPRKDRGIIRRKVHSGRSTFYCPVCQR